MQCRRIKQKCDISVVTRWKEEQQLREEKCHHLVNLLLLLNLSQVDHQTEIKNKHQKCKHLPSSKSSLPKTAGVSFLSNLLFSHPVTHRLQRHCVKLCCDRAEWKLWLEVTVNQIQLWKLWGLQQSRHQIHLNSYLFTQFVKYLFTEQLICLLGYLIFLLHKHTHSFHVGILS